jgi:hypothetical protein
MDFGGFPGNFLFVKLGHLQKVQCKKQKIKSLYCISLQLVSLV